MRQGPAIPDIERGQILALHKECISFRRIAQMVHCAVGSVQGVLRQVRKNKHPKHWKGNQKISKPKGRL